MVHIYQDALGHTVEKSYKGYIAVGQLNVKVNAEAHYKSVHLYYRYYLDGVLRPKTVIKYWD